MKKYLFICGPAGGEYHETNGDVNVIWYRSPVFSVSESDEIKPLGVAWAYNLRSLAIGEDYTHVYALSTMCNAEVIDLLLTDYVESQ